MRRTRLAVGFVMAALLLAALPVGAASAATEPQVHVGDATIHEPVGKNGTVAVEVPVTVAPASTSALSITWRTLPGTAGTADFVNESGSLTLPSGTHGAVIAVDIRADRLSEGTESFSVELTSATGATIGDGTGTVTIVPSGSGLAINDLTATEPDAGSSLVRFAATLPTPPKKDVSFTWELRSGSATVGSDVVAASGSGVIPRNAQVARISVAIIGDTVVEPDESLDLVVTSVRNASLTDGIGRLTIRNTDAVVEPPPPPPPDEFGWMPPEGSIPASGTVLYLESFSGDYIGQGATYTYTPANSLITVGTAAGRVSLSIKGDEGWNATFSQGSAEPAVEKAYLTGLHRYPFYEPGLSFSGEGRGCNTLDGRFIVDEVSYVGSSLRTLQLRFEQRCTPGSTGSLFGFLRYDVDDPTAPPPPGDVADFPWSPAPGSVPASGNYVYYQSAPGDYIGQGATELYTPDNATIRLTETSGRLRLSVDSTDGDWWFGDFTGPDADVLLLPGLYDGLQRYPFHNPVEGGLNFSGNGRGCNELAGAFAVDHIAYDALGLASVSLRFVQRCEVVGAPLYGALRWSRP